MNQDANKAWAAPPAAPQSRTLPNSVQSNSNNTTSAGGVLVDSLRFFNFCFFFSSFLKHSNNNNNNHNRQTTLQQLRRTPWRWHRDSCVCVLARWLGGFLIGISNKNKPQMELVQSLYFFSRALVALALVLFSLLIGTCYCDFSFHQSAICCTKPQCGK